jgi:hypothetical protein
MDTCPQCKRKLLSHASAKCNWCGCEINDEGYQQQAAQERAAFRIHEAERDAIESARSAAMAPNIVTGWGRPMMAMGALGNSWQRGKQMEATARAQAKAMQEYAATGQSADNVAVEQPWQPQGTQPQATQPQTARQPLVEQPPTSQPQAANNAQPAQEEEAPTLESDVRQMFRHLEL